MSGEKNMKILQVIHGYPPQYMAGSEVYTWNLAKEQAREHEVHVFTRVENPFADPYQTIQSTEDGVHVWRTNKPTRDYTFRDKYLDPHMDSAFRSVMRQVNPDIVHFGHLSHLSSHLPEIARYEFGTSTLLTIHDFWLYCFRGQLIRPDLSLCEGPSIQSCLDCARQFFKEWMDKYQVEERLNHIQHVANSIDAFLAPSQTVTSFFQKQGVPDSKIHFSPYGFDVTRICPRQSKAGNGPLRIGFMGRIIPVKGIHVLLKAFSGTIGQATLEVWGSTGTYLPWLQSLCNDDSRVHFRGGYHNEQIQQVLESMDVLVAPSIWLENAPLVIQEAMLAELPVITSAAGGMKELVKDGNDGFLLPLGDTDALRSMLQQLMDNPFILEDLRPDRNRVRTIEDDATFCLSLYRTLASKQSRPTLPVYPAPRRITFVTNPGLCNLHCIMCDTHSSFSKESPLTMPILDFEIVETVVTQLAPRGLSEIIPSTMGEPLLYPHFRSLLELAARSGVKVNLTTNGTFPHGGVGAWAEKLLPVVSDVKFSVNGIDPSVAGAIMWGLNSERQLANIQRYLELKHQYESGGGQASTVSLQVTFMESNLDELPKILHWAIQNGIDRFKGHHLWVTWPQLTDQSLGCSENTMAKWNDMVATLHDIAKHKIRLDNVVPIRSPSDSSPSSRMRCPFLGREAWVESDGSFQVCCCPSQKRSAFGVFGNLNETPFMKIWRSIRYRDFVANWGIYPTCEECNMRRHAEDNNDD